MDLYLFTSGKPHLQAGWTDQDVITLFGSVTVDLTQAPPGDDAALTVFLMFGSAKVIVPRGSQISTGGISIFGGRDVHVQSGGTGPRMHLTLSSVFGSIKVVEAGVSELD